MYYRSEIDNRLINKIDEILNDFKDFEQAIVNNNGDIIIRKKNTKRKSNDCSILTNIFKEIIKKDLKKTGFKTLFRIYMINGILRYKFYQRLL